MKYIVLFIITITTTLSHAQGISVSPSRIFLTGKPGQTVSQSVQFTNNSTQDFQFVASLKDWDRDSTGVKKYYPPGSLKASNAHNLLLSETVVELLPGERKKVEVTMVIPEDAQEVSHSMLFFTQVKEQQQQNFSAGIGMNVLLEVGIQIYHTPPGLSPGNWEFLAFEDLGFSEDQTTRTLAIKVENTGEIPRDADLRFEVTNMATGEDIPISSIPLAVFPKTQQWVSLNLPADLKGKYLVVAFLDSGIQYDLKIAKKEISY